MSAEALFAYDKIIGLDLSDLSVDGSWHKSPAGGEGTGPNPTDRGKLGWKWLILTDLDGIPLGDAIDGANRNDSVMLAPTLDDANAKGLLLDIETILLDRDYGSDVTREYLAESNIDDTVIAKKRKQGAGAPKKNQPMGLRWPGRADQLVALQLRSAPQEHRPSTASLRSHSPSCSFSRPS